MHQNAAQTITNVCLSKIPGDIRLTARRGARKNMFVREKNTAGGFVPVRVLWFVAFMLLKRITAAKLNKMQDKRKKIAPGVY